MSRVANYQINGLIQKFQEFVNYNGTITAEIDDKGIYRITHWRTTILEYDVYNHQIVSLTYGYISQTTSTLVGRILRSLPQPAVENYLGYFSPSAEKRRLVKMLNTRAYAY
jgi:hypothetical protein